MTLKGLMCNWWWRIICLANKRRGGLGSNWACKDALHDGFLNTLFLASNGGAYGVLGMFTARMIYCHLFHWRGVGPGVLSTQWLSLRCRFGYWRLMQSRLRFMPSFSPSLLVLVS
jgi:hypothetical protein